VSGWGSRGRVASSGWGHRHPRGSVIPHAMASSTARATTCTVWRERQRAVCEKGNARTKSWREEEKGVRVASKFTYVHRLPRDWRT
jgi:hypothetical protein